VPGTGMLSTRGGADLRSAGGGGSTVELEVWVATRRSLKHTENEDRAVVGEEVIDDASVVEHRTLTTPALLAAVDGLGGHTSGHVASDLAAKLLAASDIPHDEEAATELLQLADRTLHDAMRNEPRYEGMGATVAMLAINGSGAVVANAGDSSAWRLRQGKLEALSVTDRMGASGVLQCLGAHEGVSPHVRQVTIEDGDRLLLASDGLTDVVPHEVIESYLEADVSGAAQQMLTLVEKARLPDDVTIVIAEAVRS
jgi:PPM family protein phosphatase